MKLHNVLFIRYLLRQRLITLVVALVVCAITNLTVILASKGQTGVLGIMLLIIIIVIWFFPIYLIIITTINYFTLQKALKNIGSEKELFERMTNQLIRELVVKNGIKISVFLEKKSDYEKFSQIIDEELKFQRRKIELLKGN